MTQSPYGARFKEELTVVNSNFKLNPPIQTREKTVQPKLQQHR